MSGRHAAERIPERTGRAVLLLGLLGVFPPVVILGPRIGEATASAPAGLSAHIDEPHVCRCGPITSP